MGRWTGAVALLVALGPAAAQADEEADEAGIGWATIPALNYNTDDGFGYGAITSLYWNEPGLEPYKLALTLRFFMTTNWIHAHEVKVDALEVGGLPLRLSGLGGYYSTGSDNFCGFGGGVTCDPVVAERLADDLGLTGGDRDDLVRRYYLLRYRNPYLVLNGRWRLSDLPHKVEVMAGWRGHYYATGSSEEGGPYPNSLHESLFPRGDDGLASVAQAGLMIDDRDNEPAPSRGYWAEASVRGASGWWGSAWDYAGVNVTLRGYVPLVGPRTVVLADRLVLDGTMGDPPVQELARPGGSQDYTGFGGQYMGRGIRARRFLGKAKLMNQAEVRWRLLAGRTLALELVAFGDAGVVAEGWGDLADELGRLLWGAGGGLRVFWGEDFAIRADVGFSPVESGPGVYVNVNHLF